MFASCVARDAGKNRRDLRHADAADHAGRADRTRAHADFDGSHTGFHQIPGGFFGGDVSGDNIHVRRSCLLASFDCFDHAQRMSMRGIDHNDVHLGAYQFRHALQIIPCGANGSADAQPALVVFRGERVFDLLGDVLDRDQSLQVLIVVHNQQFLDPVLVQNALRFFQRGADRNRDEIFLGHHLAYRQSGIAFQTADRDSSGCRPAGRFQ